MPRATAACSSRCACSAPTALSPGRCPPATSPACAPAGAPVQASAFDFEPDEPVDWLLCDMAWRPLEVAHLLAKWGRRHWATTLVANVKLPMKQRVVFARKVLEVVRGGSWQDVRARQLYHDRE